MWNYRAKDSSCIYALATGKYVGLSDLDECVDIYDTNDTTPVRMRHLLGWGGPTQEPPGSTALRGSGWSIRSQPLWNSVLADGGLPKDSYHFSR